MSSGSTTASASTWGCIQRSSSSGSRAASGYSIWLLSPIPSVHARPSASYGATPAIVAAARTRSGSNAAHASACGPPPDQPIVRNRSAPR